MFDFVIIMIKIAFDFLFRPQLFRPTLKLKHFEEIYQLVQEGRIEMIFTDKDDTITRYRQFSLIDDRMRTAIKKIEERGVEIKILSNGIRDGDPLDVENISIVKTKEKKPYNGQ